MKRAGRGSPRLYSRGAQSLRTKKIGRVPLFPLPIKELLNKETSVGQLLHIVVRAAGDTQPTADQFFADIDNLLAQVRKPDARGTMEPPFADRARKRTLKELRENLPKAPSLVHRVGRRGAGSIPRHRKAHAPRAGSCGGG